MHLPTMHLPTIHFLEPHPTHKSNYIPSGRGGAGNLAAYTPSTLTHGATATGPASRAPLDRRSTSPPLQRTTTAQSQQRRKSTVSLWSTTSTASQEQVSTGRGGAGNAVPASQRAVYDFEGELKRATAEKEKDVVYVGRGGAGNAVRARTQSRDPKERMRRPSGVSFASVRSAVDGDGWRGRVAKAMGRE